MKKPKKPAKGIPFDFVLEALSEMDPYTKPMFGCTAIYIDLRIIFILREKENHTVDNGVWIATGPEHHKSLKKDFPNMRSIKLFGAKTTAWQNLPSNSTDFEEAVLKACDFVLTRDPRIGKIPGSKK